MNSFTFILLSSLLVLTYSQELLGQYRISHLQNTSGNSYRYNPIALTNKRTFSKDKKCSVFKIEKEDCCGCCDRQKFEVLEDKDDECVITYIIRKSEKDESELYKAILKGTCPPKDRVFELKIIRSWGNDDTINNAFVQMKDRTTGLCLSADPKKVKAPTKFEKCEETPSDKQQWFFNKCSD